MLLHHQLVSRSASFPFTTARSIDLSGQTTSSLASTSHRNETRLQKSWGHDPSFFVSIGCVKNSELVRVQYLCLTDIGDARIIVEKPRCNLIRNLQSQFPITSEHLDLYIREVVGNGGLSWGAHVATAFTASVHHRITGSPGFIDDFGDLFQQHLFCNYDELASLLGHVGYLSKYVFIKLYYIKLKNTAAPPAIAPI